MALHRLTSITMGVPNDTAAYYAEFGLSPDGDGWFTTRDAGRQLRIVHAPTRRLVELHVGVDDADDLARAAANLARLGIDVRREPARISAVEKATGTRAVLEIAGRVEQCAVPATRYNGPGRYERSGQRAPGVLRTEPVMPRKLGHAVLGSTDTRSPGPSSSTVSVSRSATHQGRRHLHALLHRSPQRPGARRPGVVPAPHLLAGRRHRRGRPRRPEDARG